jgi:hypothetical protein
MRIFTVLMLFFVILLSNNDYLLASTTGYTGRLTSGTGCTSCHSTQNTAISLTHSGSTTVVGGTKVDWTITVARTSATKSGIDIGVKNSSGATVGTVSTTATGLKVASGEITHSSTRTMSGGSYVYSFSWTAPTTPGTYYLRALAVAGAATTNNWNYMTPITITVTAAPTVSITKPIGAESWCMNSSQNITWNSSNIDNVRIELSSDGGATFGTEIVASTPASAGTYAWTVPSSLIPLNTYKVRISDASNSTYKSVSPANFTVLPLTEIKTNPVAKIICENEGVIFTVVAAGSALHYEWRHDDVLVSNPIDAPTLQLTKCTPDMAGNYTCIITGACGLAVTTTAVKLTINKPVAILAQPLSQIVCKGTPASIKFSVTGNSLKFQWKKNGTAINGKTDSILSFPAIVSSDSGSYTCDVSSSCGSIITSDAAVFTYNSNPQISKQPVAVTALENDSVAIGVIATGGNLQYKWKKNGVDIVPAVNSPYLIFSKVATTNAGDYNCIISNNCNSVSSSTAKLTVNKTAGGPILKLSMSSFSFDTVKAKIEKDTIINEVIKNTGDQDLVISSIALNGADASLYSLIPPVLPKTLKPGETTNLEIKFSGTICGAKEAIVNVKSNATEENLALYAYVINTSVGFDQFVAFYTIDKGQKPDTNRNY